METETKWTDGWIKTAITDQTHDSSCATQKLNLLNVEIV